MSKFQRVKALGLANALAVLLTAAVWADTLVLKNGQVLQGTYKGGTESVMQFEANGKIHQVAVADVTSLTVSPRPTPPPPPPPPPAAPAAAMATGPVTVPAGTKLMVKLEKSVNTQANPKGSTITGFLDLDLTVNGVVVAPKGSKLYGKVTESDGGRVVGKPIIAIQYTDLVVGNQQVPIVTDPIGAEGERSGAIKKVAAGALIGGAIDGGQGAGTGALIGAGVAVMAGGRHIQIAAGTLAEVFLKQPLTVTR
jgi:hypothetical protein